MANKQVATLAGGCFWCIESAFNTVEGVDKAISGYAGGEKQIQPMKKSAKVIPAMQKWYK